MSVMAETTRLVVGPDANGMLLAPQEFDRAEFADGWRYELIHGVLIVSPIPSRKERDPNEELGRWLRNYLEDDPNGKSLDSTLSEETIHVGDERRRADRVIWAGLGRLPEPFEPPTIVVEFVSSGRRSRERDYDEKREEYLALGVKEYWIIDRFARTLTVYRPKKGKGGKQTIRAEQSYATPLLPGFNLPLARLLELADRWDD